MFLTYYENEQRFCADPQLIHAKTISMDQDTAIMAGVKPGQKLCINCRKNLAQYPPEDEPDPSEMETAESDSETITPNETLREELNTSAIALVWIYLHTVTHLN
ncbi:uncharacterized protein LOC143228277 [Tachypleus tridentatus]|uniref:uncharacterized protein LOC143228277 n=1 Tax=Tachypleus tridentatus TaxID=6853 RepID=UPI003FD0EC4A